MDTKEIMSRKSRLSQAMDWMSEPAHSSAEQTAEASDRIALLEEPLQLAPQRAARLELQKENLSQTCLSHAA